MIGSIISVNRYLVIFILYPLTLSRHRVRYSVILIVCDCGAQDTLGTSSVQAAYVRQHAPQLLSQLPKDMNLLHTAHMCVAWVQAGRSRTHPEAKRLAEFLKSRKKDLLRGTRILEDEVCKVLCEGIPGWLDTIKGEPGPL
jgi:hypothetical protein